MSADLMLVSSKKNENFDNHHERCFCIDETSMGEPHTDFGLLLSHQCIIDDELIKKVKYWFEVLEHKEYIDLEELISWLENHKGEYVETECW